MRDDGLAAVLAAKTEPQAVCDRLVDEANRAGGEDNTCGLGDASGRLLMAVNGGQSAL